MSALEGKMRRRNLLKAAVGLSAAGAIGVPALVFRGGGHDQPATSAAAQPMAPAAIDDGQPIVAFIQDASRGEITIMSGEESVVIVDRDLVARLSSMGRL